MERGPGGAKHEDPDSFFDLDLFFDRKKRATRGSTTSGAIEAKTDSRAAEDQFRESESQDKLRDRIKLSMQREYSKNRDKHDRKMVQRIVRYAIRKHKDCP